MDNNKKERKILVAKMYTGEYIEKNIGHEIINFFKPDNGDYLYGYIIYNGKVKYCDEIDTILLVGDIKNGKVEILAKIDNPEFISNTENTPKKQVNYIRTHNITYGGVLLNQIMNKNETYEDGFYITYRTKNIKKPANKKFILLKDCKEEENKEQLKLEWNIGHNLGYISSTKKKEQYDKLIEYINNSIIWKKVESKKITKEIMDEYSCINEENKLMDLISKKYDENIFSNMLYYYFYEKKMFKDFAKDVLNVDLSNDIKIYKEKSTFSNTRYGRIDIFAKDTTNQICVVIENKLKSGINGRYYENDSKTQGSQLDKYREWVDEKFGNYNKKYFIFVPNYKEDELRNHLDINHLMPKDKNKDLYEIITYKKIFNYFNSNKAREKMSADKYYDDFVNALSYHIYTANKEMERKFVNAIRKVENK